MPHFDLQDGPQAHLATTDALPTPRRRLDRRAIVIFCDPDNPGRRTAVFRGRVKPATGNAITRDLTRVEPEELDRAICEMIETLTP